MTSVNGVKPVCMHTEGQLNFYHLGYYHLDCHLDQKARRNTRLEQNFNIDGPKQKKNKKKKKENYESFRTGN